MQWLADGRNFGRLKSVESFILLRQRAESVFELGIYHEKVSSKTKDYSFVTIDLNQSQRQDCPALLSYSSFHGFVLPVTEQNPRRIEFVLVGVRKVAQWKESG